MESLTDNNTDITDLDTGLQEALTMAGNNETAAADLPALISTLSDMADAESTRAGSMDSMVSDETIETFKEQ